MARPTVILVHGLWMKGLEMSYLRRCLRELGYPVEQFRYRTVASNLASNCTRLRAFIQRHNHPVALIGHSLGGVLSLHTLCRYPELPVAKVICIGSPLVDTAAGRSMYGFKAGRFILGRLLPEAVFHSPLKRWNGKQRVGVIAGTRSMGPGQIMARLSRPNDGTVAVAETRLPGITDHLEWPLSHLQLLFSKGVAEQCDAFLQHSRFSLSV
jgi:pimeloyl-ACP methyl ester carboxylesterase